VHWIARGTRTFGSLWREELDDLVEGAIANHEGLAIGGRLRHQVAGVLGWIVPDVGVDLDLCANEGNRVRRVSSRTHARRQRCRNHYHSLSLRTWLGACDCRWRVVVHWQNGITHVVFYARYRYRCQYQHRARAREKDRRARAGHVPRSDGSNTVAISEIPHANISCSKVPDRCSVSSSPTVRDAFIDDDDNGGGTEVRVKASHRSSNRCILVRTMYSWLALESALWLHETLWLEISLDEACYWSTGGHPRSMPRAVAGRRWLALRMRERTILGVPCWWLMAWRDAVRAAL